MKNCMNLNPNEKQSQTQCQKILAFLQQGGRITSLSALNQFGCLRLSARIKDLRDEGYQISDRFIKVPSGKKVKEYFMEMTE